MLLILIILCETCCDAPVNAIRALVISCVSPYCLSVCLYHICIFAYPHLILCVYATGGEEEVGMVDDSMVTNAAEARKLFMTR